eukprot:9499775-Pyramimonas_sp.AAC.1
MEAPARKVLLTRSYKKLDPQRASSWAIDRLQEIRSLCPKGQRAYCYCRLSRALEKLVNKCPFNIVWKKGAMFWISLQQTVRNIMYMDSALGVHALEHVGSTQKLA